MYIERATVLRIDRNHSTWSNLERHNVRSNQRIKHTRSVHRICAYEVKQLNVVTYDVKRIAKYALNETMIWLSWWNVAASTRYTLREEAGSDAFAHCRKHTHNQCIYILTHLYMRLMHARANNSHCVHSMHKFVFTQNMYKHACAG